MVAVTLTKYLIKVTGYFRNLYMKIPINSEIGLTKKNGTGSQKATISKAVKCMDITHT